ncbi:hypothetical protein [Limnobacter parvus]|uniref:DUF4148 domain-containing protein n=1 Tax=Limnobacter parvus TaxID=2939690 RepID=A0ABT1XEE8_9BURK|nr:hypothetical protein [Limnobacter parvus]MCR2745645.1 hypothetical protein [Limnobacter parvus]
MNPFVTKLTGLLLCALPVLAIAEENKGTTDQETGLSTRTWLKEQAEGTNRGEVEPYSAESAGKAYRSYTESIGAKDQPAPTSQVSTIQTN